tara:strand:+ start:1089 stop:2132 length:1044 start_codon:yes stop_codon:yes gene_type:complete
MLVTSYNDFSCLAHTPKGKIKLEPITIIDSIDSIDNLNFSFKDVNNPAFILKHPNNNYFYTCNESINDGTISTFKLTKNKLELLGNVSSGGKSSCYLLFDKKLENIININYWDSSITLHPIENFIIKEFTQRINPPKDNKINFKEEHLLDRQSTSHHHSCIFYKDYLYVPDLGTDRIDIYSYKNKKLNLFNFIQLDKGSGPRYSLIFKNFMYIINELSNSISIINLETSKNKIVQTISTIPSEFNGINTCGSIQIHKNLNILYASNRGHNSIAIFKILDNHKLELLKIEDAKGKTPRFFNISNDMKKIYVANQDTNNISIFIIENNGNLKFDKHLYCNSPNFILDLT